MSYANGRIYVDTSVTPNIGVSIYDIQRALSTSKDDIGSLCRHGSINVFSKWKPFRYNQKKFTSESQRLSMAKALNYGCGIVSCGIVDFAQKYTQRWTHNYPRGENGGTNGYDEEYRFKDFDGYQHRKWQMGEMAGGRGLYTMFNGYMQIPSTLVSDLDVISFVMQCRENDDIYGDTGLLYPYDFNGAAKDISGYYLGIAILEDRNGGSVWVYSDQQVSSFTSGTNVVTGIYPQISSSISNGALKIVPILAQKRTGAWNSNYDGDIIILDGAYLSANKVAQSANVQSSVTFTVSGSNITLDFSITNATGDAVTINNMVCYLLSEAAFMNEHDNGYSGYDYRGEGATAYIMRTWPLDYKQGDIYSHDWNGGYSSPDQLAARYYNAYSDFFVANGNTNLIGNNTTRTWSKTFNYTQDDFGAYANGAWALLCLAPQGNSFVREYKSY